MGTKETKAKKPKDDGVGQKPLTEDNLESHNELLNRQPPTERVLSWAEQIIAEERTHQFHAQLTASVANMQTEGTNMELDLGHIDQQISAATTTGKLDQTVGSLKLFEQRPSACLETPLERFLTPGSSDPSYFHQPALAHMGIQFGSMEGAAERRDIARANAEVARDRAYGAQEKHP
ncbi:hypothetical protein P175DRAFT_0504818 [Aspergillus ochraceoroseus IBT 24754]|uniref:Uncharacterized protein n=1 Tax=Aspergillus ochraceoroseus IBT 24754 TaxID=1392256 RepID=A0A2T5LMM1_9EURO|nr:uncharacterized protein P175DRAFT_0504818 [Aspergillus ochraceoroseus IBT 24754]PTU17523.1 hypothetical protein P175DRAFT_0504818 [Aspergillus ochraceoroseus IBT 24754]